MIHINCGLFSVKNKKKKKSFSLLQSLLEESSMIILILVLKSIFQQHILNQPPHDKTNKMAYVPSEDSDQPGHLPSLISLHYLHEESLGP